MLVRVKDNAKGHQIWVDGESIIVTADDGPFEATPEEFAAFGYKLEAVGTQAPQADEPTTVDPSLMTVEEVKGLDLPPDKWRQVLALEQDGKNRSSLIAFIEDKLSG